MKTQDDLAEHVRDWMVTAFADLADDIETCVIDGPDRNAAVLEGIARFVADAVLSGTSSEGHIRRCVGDYVCRRVMTQIETVGMGAAS